MNSSLKILVTGASGFVGKYLCTELVGQGKSIRVASRSVNMWAENIEAALIAEIDGMTDWCTALTGVDSIVHLAARVHVIGDVEADPLTAFRRVNVDGTLNLARQAAAAGVRRFIFISSIGVNGNGNERPFTEEDMPNPQEPYALSKFEAEQGLRMLAKKTNMEVVIIRPPLVYGINAPGNFANMLNVIRCIAKLHLPLPLGAINNERSLVAVQNLVSFIIMCLHHPAAANQTFLVADGVDVSTPELLHACAAALRVNLWLLAIPQQWLELGASLLCKQAVARKLYGSLQVDITKARTVLGWKPPVSSVTEGLKLHALDLS